MNEVRRPDFLTALCILTFIGSGFAFVVYLFALLFFNRVSEFIVEYSALPSTNGITPLYFMIYAALTLFSLIGAMRMWNLRRDGFFIYSASQILIFLFPVFWNSNQSFPAVSLIFTLIFIVCYAVNFKHLK